MADIRILHRRALATCTEIVDQVKTAQLGLPTPCAEWTLGDLLAHMTVQNYGFAAAATGEQTDMSFWEPTALGADPAAEHRASAEAVIAAFADDGATEREFWLPELSATVTFTGSRAIGFHYIDSVVHGWDVAKSIGFTPEFDRDLLNAVLPLTLTVPGGAYRDRPGSSFGTEIAAAPQASTLDQVVAWLGRDPGWRP